MKYPNLFPTGVILAPACLALLASHSFASARGDESTATRAPDAPPEMLRENPWTSVIYDEPGDGHLWAVGAQWKASFGAEGVVYYPRAGASEPRKLPHALSPDLVTIGGESFPFERAAHAVQSGDRVELQRGLFTERYDLAPETIEQSFVFESLPRAGDLVLRIPVASELDAVETDAGLEFRSERGRLQYSRAVAVDAHGRRTLAATHIEDGAITIRVGADVLADAAFPLVIDPILGAIFPDSTTSDTFAIDAAYDSFNQVWVTVHELVFSASDHDVIAKMYSTAGALIAQSSVDVSTDSWVSPRIADLASAHKFLVVGGATAASNGAQTVRGRIVQPNGTLLTMDPQISISGPVGVGTACVQPDVGGDSTTTSTSWCVVFQRDVSGSSHAILRALVSGAGAIVFGPTTIPQIAGTTDGTPSISKSNDGAAWLATWEHAVSLSGSLEACRIATTGAIITSTFTIVSSATSLFDPIASSPLSGSSRYAVAYQAGFAFGPQGSTIGVALIEGGTVLQLADLMVLENSNTAAQNQVEPSVDSDGQHFLVSYSEFDPAFSHYKLFVTDLAVAGNTLQVSQNHLEPQPGLGLSQLGSNVAAARAPGTLAHRYLAVYDITENSTDHDVAGRFIDGVSGGPASAFCLGDGTGTACPCGNSGAAGRGCANSMFGTGSSLQLSSGFASTIADTAVLQAAGVPPGGAGLFFQGTTAAAGSAFGDGLLCASGTILRLAVKFANPAGVATYPQAGEAALSVAGAVPLAGGLRTYQYWYRDSASFCTASTFNTSNGLAIQWAR